MHEIDEAKHESKDDDRGMKRSLEIVVQVFSKAANELVGLDRDWQ